ncbi:MAG: apolipoprotein N-acyltransferase [Actinomycetota bacterium]|nr:apolipoprotein N-acyltransferase [Actinomycetota bacterium]
MVNIATAIIAGVLLSGAFAPFALWWLAPMGIALHMYSISQSNRPYLNSFIFGAVFNAIALHWTSTFVGAAPWLILVLLQAILYIPLGLVKQSSIAWYPLIFLGMEQIRTIFPFGGFGWLRIAYSAADAPYRQIAAIGGAAALSGFTLSISLVLFSLYARKLYILPLLPVLLLLIPVNLQSVGSVRVLMVQGDVPKLGLDFNSNAKEVFKKHVTESKKALEKDNNVDFILWPENSADVDPFRNKDVEKSLNTFAQPLIIGAVIRSQGLLQNVSILWSKKEPEIYVKQHLTPFGEYIPLRTLARRISPLSDIVTDITPGTSSKFFSFASGKVAPIICFELVDDAILDRAAAGSNLFVIQTNSATFGRSAESAQQLGISRIRAIEHGRNALSVSTTGISAQIDYKGEIIHQMPIHRPAHFYAQSELLEGQTPRDRAGNWALVGAFIWLIALGARRKRLYR